MNKEVLAFIGRQHDPAVMAADRRRPKRARYASMVVASDPWVRSARPVLPGWMLPAVLGAALALHVVVGAAVLLWHPAPPRGPMEVAVQMVAAPKPVVKPAVAKVPAAAKPVHKEAAKAAPAKPVVKAAPKLVKAVVHEVVKAPEKAARAPAAVKRAVIHVAAPDGVAAKQGFMAAVPFGGAGGNPRLAYPAAARAAGEQGVVVLNVSVVPDGNRDDPVTPQDVAVAQSSGFADLDAAARDTVSRWHFRPATRGGVPVPFVITLSVPFQPGD